MSQIDISGASDILQDIPTKSEVPHGLNLGSSQGSWLEWIEYKERFLLYLEDSGLSDEPEKAQIDVLFSCMGSIAHSIEPYVREQTLISHGTSENTQLTLFESILRTLDEYFQPKDNHLYQATLLNRRSQSESENNHQYISHVCELAKQCDRWDDCQRNEMIMIQLLTGMRDQTLSIELQQKRDLTVTETIQRMQMSDTMSTDQGQYFTDQIDMKEEYLTVEPREGLQTNIDMKEAIELDDKRTSFQQSYMKNGIKGFESQEPYLKDLAETYEERFANSRDWKDALKAFSLYNSAAVKFSASPTDPWNIMAWNPIRDYLGPRKKSTKEKFYEDVEELKDKLLSIRKTLGEQVNKIKQENGDYTEYQVCKEAALKSNSMMLEFASSVIHKAIETMEDYPPCSFAAVGVGSLGRGEATPYSDVEYLFLIDDSTHEKYFERLAVMTYFFFGSLRETKLSSLDIDELKGWFVDGRMRGCQIDGITETSGNVPTGNKTSPNVFLSTTSKLLAVYKEILHHPSDDASRGDLTAMLSFTKLIFSQGNGKRLLGEFVAGKQQVDGHMPQIRMDANIKMLAGDLTKYEFSPDFNEYITGFSMNVKSLVYRFPSLLVLALSVILGKPVTDSWNAIEGWPGQTFCRYLQISLASACFSRLCCYLHMGSCRGDFQLIPNEETNTANGYEKSSRQLIFSPEDIWQMTTEEFLEISECILILQNGIEPMVQSKTALQIEELMQREFSGGQIVTLLANFYSCNWSYIVREARHLDFSNLELTAGNAVARSHLQMREYKTALPLFVLLKERSQRVSGKALFRMEIYRGLARCYEGMGLLANAEKTYEEAQVFSKLVDGLGKERALVKMELASLRLYRDGEKSLTMLLNALRALLIHAATEGKTESDELMCEYEKCGDEDRLQFLSNPTREIAHCVYEIGKIFDISGKEVLAQAYYTKARRLGLRMVIDDNFDCVTKVTILQDVGQKFNAPQYLQKALEILDQHPIQEDKAKQMECEILLSEATCYSKEKEVALARLPEDEELNTTDLDGANNQIVHDPEVWLRQTERKMNDVYPDQQHYNYGKLYKAMGGITGRREENSDTTHGYYAKATDVFVKQDCKVEAATVYRADGALYSKEKNMKKADAAYKQAQLYLKEYIGHTSKSEYAHVLSERSEVLAAIGSLEESEALKLEADEMHEETEALRQKMNSAVDAHCERASDGATYVDEKDLERADASYRQAQSLKNSFGKPEYTEDFSERSNIPYATRSYDMSEALKQESEVVHKEKAATENLETIPSTSATEQPTTLELIKYEKTSGYYTCVSQSRMLALTAHGFVIYAPGVSWTEEDNILCSTRGGVEVRSGADLKLIKKINMTGVVWSAYSVGDKLITKVAHEQKVSTYIGTESHPQQTLLHHYNSYNCSQLSVSDSRIADIDRESKQLMIYTITGDHLYNIDLSDRWHPTGVHILPDEDSVLVSDSDTHTWRGVGEVRKYKLQPGKHEPVCRWRWRCRGQTHPEGITSDQSGLIYVVSKKKMYQISPQGGLIRELTHAALSELAALSDVSVRGDKMAVCGDHGAALFKLS